MLGHMTSNMLLNTTITKKNYILTSNRTSFYAQMQVELEFVVSQTVSKISQDILNGHFLICQIEVCKLHFQPKLLSTPSYLQTYI